MMINVSVIMQKLICDNNWMQLDVKTKNQAIAIKCCTYSWHNLLFICILFMLWVVTGWELSKDSGRIQWFNCDSNRQRFLECHLLKWCLDWPKLKVFFSLNTIWARMFLRLGLKPKNLNQAFFVFLPKSLYVSLIF